MNIIYGTQVSGYQGKQISSSHQGEVLGEPGCDCGSTKYIKAYIGDDAFKKFPYRYFKGAGGKLVCLTPEVAKSYKGRTVEMRSVMYCKTVGKEGYICSKCAGEFYYKLGKRNIGLVCKNPVSELTQAALQKFHQNVIKTHELDLDKLLL